MLKTILWILACIIFIKIIQNKFPVVRFYYKIFLCILIIGVSSALGILFGIFCAALGKRDKVHFYFGRTGAILFSFFLF